MKKQARINIIIISGIILFLYFIVISTKTSQVENKSAKGSIPDIVFDTLVWSDEFNGNGPINTEKWFHQTKLPPGGSWYGGLINHYTDRQENTYLKNGYLNLIAKKEIFENQKEKKITLPQD